MSSDALSRRSMILTAAGAAGASIAAAQEKVLGPPPHKKGPKVFLDYDQVELDAAYDQSVFVPVFVLFAVRLKADSDVVRTHLGNPQRIPYGTKEKE